MWLNQQNIITEIKNHTREVRNEAELIKYKIQENLLVDESPKRINIEWITIDKESSKDLDDWIWAEKHTNWYTIYISIADISEIIKPESILDLDAYSRTTSVYTNSYVYHMFPSEISTDLASLNDDTKRKTITTKIDLNNDFNTTHSEIFESIFHNKKRFTYSEFNKQFNNYSESFHKDLNLFHEIAKWLYKKRIWYWARNDYNDKVTLNIDNSWKTDNNHSIASFIIQEFMISANIENAKINFKEKINWIYRLHMPELKWKLSLKYATKRAFYNYKNWFHYWLWENFYWHFTSPIRRYADLINHRQQKAWIRKEPEIYNINQIRNITLNINSTIERTLELEKTYNKNTTDKRIERFIKKLSNNDYENISSVTKQFFSKLIAYFIQNPQYLNIDSIKNEIIYRIQFDLLDEISISKLRSTPNNIKEFDIFKNLIDIKKIKQ